MDGIILSAMLILMFFLKVVWYFWLACVVFVMFIFDFIDRNDSQQKKVYCLTFVCSLLLKKLKKMNNRTLTTCFIRPWPWIESSVNEIFLLFWSLYLFPYSIPKNFSNLGQLAASIHHTSIFSIHQEELSIQNGL